MRWAPLGKRYPVVWMFCVFLASLFVVYGAFTPPALSWSGTIHRTICALAWRRLGETEKRWIDTITQEHTVRRFDTGCAWPDWVRKDAAYGDTGKWHYQDHIENPALGERDWRRNCNRGCLFSAILHNEAIVRGERSGSRADALYFLMHLISDLHQPLHLGRHEDKGGNSIDVIFKNQKLHLHKLWDSTLFPKQQDVLSVLINQHIEHDAGEMTLKWPGDLLDWMEESRMIAHHRLYPYHTHTRIIDAEYVAKFRPLGYQQLALAVVRLVAILRHLARKDNDY